MKIVKDTSIQGRMAYLDVLKGVAIILVLLGHRGFNSALVQVIYFFHMPLFFFISGYLDKMQTIPTHVTASKKAKRLLYPYIVFNVLIIAYNTLFDFIRGEAEIGKLIKRIIAFLYGNYIWENNIDYIGTLWFLVGLFFSVLIANLIYHFSNKSNIRLFICFVSLMLAGEICSYMNVKFDIRLPWCIDVAFIGALFYLFGFYWKKWKQREKYEKCWVGLLFFIVGGILGYINLVYMKINNYEMVRSDMLQMNYGILPLFITSALLMSVGSMIIIKKICEKYSFKVGAHIGQLSLLIMIDHLYVYEIFDIILNRLGINRWLIFFPITLIVSILLAEIVHKYLPILFEYKKLPFEK